LGGVNNKTPRLSFLTQARLKHVSELPDVPFFLWIL